jgi:hypothetical protein
MGSLLHTGNEGAVETMETHAYDEEVHEAVISFLREAAGSWFEEGIQKLVVRMRKLIEVNGDYVEK